VSALLITATVTDPSGQTATASVTVDVLDADGPDRKEEEKDG